MMKAIELFFIAISHNVSFIGKTWWILMLVFRLLVLLVAGFTLFSDEQERFICTTIQPACSNVCFDVFAPVSVLRLWLFHLILLCLPHLMFATYVMHKVLSCLYFGSFYWERSRGGLPCTLDNSGSSRELSSQKALLCDLLLDRAIPRFCCAYFLVIVLRILLEAIFSACQFFLFGLTIPKTFLCFEAPCTSGVECYISRPTEKNLMLNFMLTVASLSVLLSLVDLVGSVKAILRCRRKREMLMEEMSKGEQSSMFTMTTMTEDTDVLLTRKISPSGSSKVNGLRDEKPAVPNGGLLHTKGTGGTIPKTSGSAKDKKPESSDGTVMMPWSPTPTSMSVSSQFVPHRHLKPPIYPQADKVPLPNPRVTTPILHLPHPPAVANAGQQSNSSGSRDKKAWV